MKIVQTTDSSNLVLNVNMDFKPDLGREEALEQFEDETIRDIINPIENYETVRFIHNAYSGLTSNPNDLHCDIWFHFYFYNNDAPQTHDGGLDYSLTGISHKENARMLRQSTKSFFRLEFFKVPDGEMPEKSNRRLVFSKNLSVPLGEKVFYLPLNDFIFVPVFMGSNYKNKENMELFWFQDESALTESILTGDTFYMSARFFNGDDGSIINFTNKSKGTADNINENKDMYYKVVIDKTNYTYEVFYYDTVSIFRAGMSGLPINFYEIIGG